MKLYSVHVQKFGLDPTPDVRLIKDGFNSWAFVFSFLWALVRGYWWVAGGLLALSVVISLILGVLGLDLFGQAVVNIAFNILVGLFANDMARWTLSKKGYVEEDLVSAASNQQGLEKYLNSLHND